MKTGKNIDFNWRLVLSCLALLFIPFSSYSQGKRPLVAVENPPRPITIYVDPTQGLIFGAFYQGTSGGTVIIYPNGTRSTTGTVVGVNQGYSYSPAIFQVNAEPGTRLTISNGPDVYLTGSNGGSMRLHIGGASPASPFTATARPPAVTLIYIGGTLTVGSPLASPPGNYTGTFSVTFIQP
ncbi:MAG TPA: hypothetical protein DCO83_03520 [Mucilaginibacter sp.]|jgi:1-acyl-sn-glycerol-3-phosphate acyltransferase|nr:hypothetical protein [Mucilaginibacter sp.]